MVHNVRYRNRHTMRRLQLELREMDKSIFSLMQQGVPSIEENAKMIQNKLNEDRFAAILKEASHQGVKLPIGGMQSDVSGRKMAEQTVAASPGRRQVHPSVNGGEESMQTRDSDSIITPQREADVPNYCPEVPPGLGK